LLKRKEWHIQIHLKVIKFVISVEKRATFETLVGTFMGGLVVVEVGLIVIVVVIIDVWVQVEIVVDQVASRRM
jgi:hypothetical protein